jgi:signal transduction histidine kinase
VLTTDPAKLRQILTHLVGNACKFTEHGQIVVETSAEQSGDTAGMLMIAVRDTGIGIPADQVSRLLQDFVQLDASNTRKYGGAGLGLSMSRRLCDLLGGAIDVTSTPGVGSTFTVKLPTDTAGRQLAIGHQHADSPAPSPVPSPS